MIDILAIGEILIDFTTDKTDAAGYPTMTAHPGGAPANFLAAAAACGLKTAIYAKVGDDYFGQTLIKTLADGGIETRGVIKTPDAFTTLAFVTLDENGDRNFSFARKPGADTQITMEDLDLSMLEETRVLHFGTLSMTDEPARSTTKKLVGLAHEKGKLVTFDPNLRKPLWKSMEDAREQMLWGLENADIVKISLEEIQFLFGEDWTASQGALWLLGRYGVKIAFITMGKEGCYYARFGGGCGQVENFNDVRTVDTTGAGDIFGGSAVYQLLCADTAPEALTEAQLRDVVTFACTAAGLSTTRSGGISSVPEKAEVLERMAK